MTEIRLPEKLAVIPGMMLNNCKSLTAVTIPESVTEIEYNAFSRCESLKSLTIPRGVEKIGRDVFRNCPELTVTVYRGTAGEEYCQKNSVPFVYAD